MATRTFTKKPTAAKNEGAGAGDSQLQKLFLDSVRDIYYAEKAGEGATKLKKAASSEQLATAIQHHIEVTKEK